MASNNKENEITKASGDFILTEKGLSIGNFITFPTPATFNKILTQSRITVGKDKIFFLTDCYVVNIGKNDKGLGFTIIEPCTVLFNGKRIDCSYFEYRSGKVFIDGI